MNLDVNQQSDTYVMFLKSTRQLNHIFFLNSFFPEGCAQQRTSRLKGVVEYYRYLLMKKLNGSIAINHLNYYHGLVTTTNEISTDGYWVRHIHMGYQI